MATAKKLPSGQWRALVYSHTETIDGKQKRIYESFTAPTKKEAEYLAAEFSLNKKRRRTNCTVGEALETYVNNKENILSPSTLRLYRSYINKYYSSLKPLPIDKLSNSQVQAEINSLSAHLSPKSVANIYGLLQTALLAQYPKIDIEISLPKRQKREIAIPTSSQIKCMLDYTEGSQLHLPIVLAFSMGLRRGEIAGLKWTDIDFEKRTMHVHSSVVLNDKKSWVTKQPKSYEGDRLLDIPDIAYEELHSIFANANSEYVYPYRPSAISNSFVRMNKALGYNFRFHDLRHYFASVMLSVNVPDKYAMRRMGHATNAVLKNVYQHLMSEKDNEVTATINTYFDENFK